MTNVASNDALMTENEFADYLNIGYGTPKDWRYRKVGPPWFKVGGMVRYRKADVDAWLERQQQGSAS
jgi:excisionase family DNA binding protein